jgi:hypothetical protein
MMETHRHGMDGLKRGKCVLGEVLEVHKSSVRDVVLMEEIQTVATMVILIQIPMEHAALEMVILSNLKLLLSRLKYTRF